MPSGILVFVERDADGVKKSAYELLGKANELAAQLGGGVSAVVVGDGAGLGAYGASTIYSAPSGHYSHDHFAAALASAIELADPAVVLGSASPVGKELFPRVGARIGAGVVTEVTELKVAGGAISARRPVYAGKAFVTATVSSDVALITVRPNSFPVPEAGGGADNVVSLDVSVSARVKVVETLQSASDVADLTEADRIVSGGRSLKSQEQFDAVVRPLAASLGATPGASRAAVDAGYAPHSAQVGQTGKVVNPQLYIALGISGAIQHLAGMRTSKVIVTVNKDPEAPIFQHTTYGIVDDLFVIAPLLQQEFEQALG
ncbi:MAG: electron transfer flavoprotein subunit alpha/FixB family protein [Alphaproteobacteria bacterium]|nr:electron transfer flavoprotein subunit alpha/FixB family protein [Alphaproteobacteria bacterium]